MSGNAWDPSLLSADSVASVKYDLLPPTKPLSPLYFTPPISLSLSSCSECWLLQLSF